jgi:DNA polymerase-3 subunit delta
MSRKDFEQHLRSEPLLSVYTLVGSERLLVSEAVAALRQKALTKAADFNRHEFSAAEAGLEAVIEAAGTLPMMGPRRFVHLSELQLLKAKEHATLIGYVERPTPTTVLCLSGEKLDQRTKLGQKLAASGGLFAFEAPRQNELAAWIERRARHNGWRIEPEAAQLLADLVGSDVGSLDGALTKLSLYVGSDSAISPEDVEEVVAPTRVHRIFDLTDAIGARDLGRSSLLLRNALGSGESALGILGMITRQLRQLLEFKRLKTRRASAQQIAASLGIRPFLVEPLASQARRYETRELRHALGAALRADIRLKSSGVSAGVVLDRFLVEIIEREHP